MTSSVQSDNEREVEDLIKDIQQKRRTEGWKIFGIVVLVPFVVAVISGNINSFWGRFLLFIFVGVTVFLLTYLHFKEKNELTNRLAICLTLKLNPDNQRKTIISDFGETLIAHSTLYKKDPISVFEFWRPESDLPYPKEIIRQALAEELLQKQDEKTRNGLEGCFLFLEKYLPEEEFKKLKTFDNFITQFVKATKINFEIKDGNLRIVEESVKDFLKGKDIRVFEEALKLIEEIPEDYNVIAENHKERVKERGYQIIALRCIGENDSNLKMEMYKDDKKTKEFVEKRMQEMLDLELETIKLFEQNK